LIAYAKDEWETDYDQKFGTAWERAMIKANKESGSSECKKILFCCKETLAPLFATKTSPIIQKGIHLFGIEFESFARTTFMSDVIQDLLEFIIRQIFEALEESDTGRSRSWLDIILELAILVLKWILLFLVQVIIAELLPGYPLILLILKLTSFFIKYIIHRLRNKIRK
jgi:hypothetical protein